jgi:hypothetical protein
LPSNLRSTLFLLCFAALAPALAAQNDVASVLKGTTLILKGSAGADVLTLSTPTGLADGDGPSPVTVQVTPGLGTTLNGSADAVEFPGVLSLKVNLGPGSDVMSLDALEFGLNPVSVNAGPGDDQLTVSGTTTGPFKFIGSSGNDSFEVEESHLDVTKVSGASGALSMPCTSTYFKELTIKSGPEIDVFNWNDVTVDFRLKLNSGGGSDLLAFTDCIVGSETTLKFGPGNDHFTDDGSLFNELGLDGGSGDDELTLEDSTLGTTMNVKLGPGLNQLSFISQDTSMVVGNTCTVKGGPQLDTFELRSILAGGVIIGNDLLVALKAGANELEMTGDVTVGNDLVYTGGGVDDQIDLNGAQLSNDANLVLAGGFNSAFLADCLIGNDLRITAGNGDDTVQLTDTEVGGNQIISLGGGNNTQP